MNCVCGDPKNKNIKHRKALPCYVGKPRPKPKMKRIGSIYKNQLGASRIIWNVSPAKWFKGRPRIAIYAVPPKRTK